MIGHGSPRASPGQPPRRYTAHRRDWIALLTLAVVLVAASHAPAAETLRVRVAFGGGGERLWEGTISLSPEGALADPQPLGIEADEPGSMWLQQGNLKIRQRSARAYDGVDIQVTASPDASLVVELTAADDPGRPIRVEVPLADLNEFFDQPLDEHGNRLLVRRTPGDLLRVVRLKRDLLLFAPGEAFSCEVEPHLLPVPDDSLVRIEARLVAARSDQELWSAEPKEIRSGQPVAIPLQLTMPQQEGVYELIVAAKYRADWREAVLRQPLRPKDWTRTVAERKVQMLVLGLEAVPPASTPQPLHQVGDVIDRADPKWHEKLGLDKLPKLPRIPRLWEGPLSNDNTSIHQHALGTLVQLNPSSQSPDVSWEAYTLPVERPGLPHVLEVDYPSDVQQTLGISILEPNAAGALRPIGLDSGIDWSEEVAGGEPVRRIQHRLVFWPRTESPRVLITNLRNGAPAAYGKIRVLAGWEHLPQASVAEPPDSQRLLAAYFDRPLFPENFSASESLDRWSGRSLDDWVTFYEAGTRLVEHLRHVGYNGLMISVLADGSTIYPSEILQPTPRYDTGVFFASGQDPLRKDVLEMLFRLFDRAGLRLIPAIEFAAPLPALESLRRQDAPAGEGIEWVGPEGNTWCQVHPTRRGLAPYYNVLHPAVQEQMLEVVRELAVRYGNHESFGGLAIRLSAHGYAQLPGPKWGMDDATIVRFQQATKLQLPGAGPGRFAQRAALLAGQHRRPWLEWRAAELGQFYRRVHQELGVIRPGSQLYLAGTNVFSGDDLQASLRPALLRRTTMADALLQVGIDSRHYRSDGQGHPGPVLLRPERITPSGNLNVRAVDLEIQQMPDVDDYFRPQAIAGSLFFHRPQEVRIRSFDEKSPFRTTYTWLVAQPVPSDRQNRRRFVHSLASLDAQVMVDGGWTLPLGQEDSLRDLVAAYRQLPGVAFQRAGDPRGTPSSQPVTFCYATYEKQTYVYVVNDAPFRATAQVRVEAPAGCRLEELTGLRHEVTGLKRDAGGAYWKVELQPYDLVAVRLSAPDVKLLQPQVPLASSVKSSLAQRIQGLGARAASLRNPPSPSAVLHNPGFERPAAEGYSLPGWFLTQRPEVVIQPDPTQAHGGSQSARLSTSGPWACLVSRPFAPPVTGRTAMSVWLRVADPAVQPTLRLALEGKLNGGDYYRFAPVGAVAGAQAAPIGAEWTQYVFQVDDLPLEGLTQLQVRFDLLGPGEVWVDDVQLYDLSFSGNELRELYRLIYRANVTLEDGQVSDCLRLLGGYWPRFLEANVPLQSTAAEDVAQRPERQATRPPKPTGVIDRLKGFLPEPLRF